MDIPPSYSTAGKVPDSEIQLLGSKVPTSTGCLTPLRSTAKIASLILLTATSTSSPGFRQELMERETAASGLSYINTKASFLKLNLYLIIDEYDNFTNTILSTYGHRDLSEGHPRRGILPLLLQRDKSRHHRQRTNTQSGCSSPECRPITLDDVTSGFYIGSMALPVSTYFGLSEGATWSAALCRWCEAITDGDKYWYRSC